MIENAEKEINEIIEKINNKSIAFGRFESDPLSLSARKSSNFILLMKLESDIGKGYFYQYFTDKKAFGYKKFLEKNYEVQLSSYGKTSEHKFDTRVHEADWLPLNERTTKYIEENKDKISDNQLLKINFNDKIKVKELKIQDLINDFGIRFKTGEIDGTDDYF